MGFVCSSLGLFSLINHSSASLFGLGQKKKKNIDSCSMAQNMFRLVRKDFLMLSDLCYRL